MVCSREMSSSLKDARFVPSAVTRALIQARACGCAGPNCRKVVSRYRPKASRTSPMAAYSSSANGRTAGVQGLLIQGVTDNLQQRRRNPPRPASFSCGKSTTDTQRLVHRQADAFAQTHRSVQCLRGGEPGEVQFMGVKMSGMASWNSAR